MPEGETVFKKCPSRCPGRYPWISPAPILSDLEGKSRFCDLSAPLQPNHLKLSFWGTLGSHFDIWGAQERSREGPRGSPGTEAFSKWPSWESPGSPGNFSSAHLGDPDPHFSPSGCQGAPGMPQRLIFELHGVILKSFFSHRLGV